MSFKNKAEENWQTLVTNMAFYAKICLFRKNCLPQNVILTWDGIKEVGNNEWTPKC